jgi:hypothetical protein
MLTNVTTPQVQGLIALASCAGVDHASVLLLPTQSTSRSTWMCLACLYQSSAVAWDVQRLIAPVCCCCPAEHIQKQLERGYAVKDAASLTFAPTPLGESLISGYRRMGLDNLWKPDLRGRIEQGISRIAAGQVGQCSQVCRCTQAAAAFTRVIAGSVSRDRQMDMHTNLACSTCSIRLSL